MKRNLILSLACMALIATSCSTVKKSTSTSMDVKSGVYQYPTVADLDVKPKVEKQIVWDFIPFNIGQPTLENRKQNLKAEIIKENNADVLLEPQMVYTKKPYGQRTLTITGYPASFKDFRKATDQDLKALEAIVPAPKMKVYNVAQPWYKRWFSKKDQSQETE